MSYPDFGMSDKALRTQEQPISFLLAAAVGNPDLISLAAGLIDAESLPLEAVQTLTSEIMSDAKAGRAALQYGTTPGLRELRELLLQHLCQLDECTPADLSLTPDNVVVTGGSQQALYILSDLVLNPGDIVIAAAPTYYVYAGTLTSIGAQVLSVPMDEHGMRTDLLEELLVDLERKGQLERVKIIYEVTYYQNPTGLSLSSQRRKHLVDLARRFSKRHRILVIDDAAYREIRFDGPTWPSVKKFDPENKYVATCMTFSKALCAGLKTGYAFLPNDLVDPFLQQKGNHDFGSNNFSQHLICRAMRQGIYHKHVEKVRLAYRAKRDAMLEAMQQYMGDLAGQVEWTRPNGGMYVWLSLPECINTGRSEALFRRCVDKGVLYVPGEYCYASPPAPHNKIRLSYGVQPAASIREGIRRLAEAVRETLGQCATCGLTCSAAGATPAATAGPAARSQPRA